MRYIYKNPDNCPMTEVMYSLGGKWKLIILYILIKGPRRFGQINNFIPSISNKVLTEQLKELQEDNIINRKVLTDRIPVNVEYSLTDKGKELTPVIEMLVQWEN